MRSDLAAARLLRPDADVIAVKFSVALVHARIAVTHHPEHAERIKRLHRERWGDEVEVHMPRKRLSSELAAHVDRLWPELSGVGGTSGWGAARLARHCLGYDEAILCGCPVDMAGAGERYHDEEVFEASLRMGAHKDRGEPFGNDRAVALYQRYIQSDFDQGLAKGITSMSGWTRKLLGAPDGR